MDEQRSAGGVALAWLTIVGTGVALVLLVRSEEPLTVKLLAVGVATIGLCLIAVFYLGSWLERTRLNRRIKALERKLERENGSG
ncbi:MAG TPA: hypothetical protein VF255_04670 [Solirubrobacterales bacterium]